MRMRHASDGHRAPDAATTKHATAFTLGLAAPYAVVHPLFERILQTGVSHGALGTDALRRLHAHTVTGKEDRRRKVLAFPYAHPLRVHGSSIDFEEAAVGIRLALRTLVPPASVALLVSHFELFNSAIWAGIDGILTIFL
jgi:hypothetical protein